MRRPSVHSWSADPVKDVRGTGIQRLDLWRSFVRQREVIDKGFVTLTDRPGIGVDMNEETGRKAQVPNTPWFMATEGTL